MDVSKRQSKYHNPLLAVDCPLMITLDIHEDKKDEMTPSTFYAPEFAAGIY